MKSLSYIPASDGSGDASLMTITQVRTAPATSITVNTVAGVPNKFFGTMGTPHTFSDPVTGETITIISEATAVSFAGRVDSGKIEIDAIADGETDLGSKVGDVILIRPNTPWANNLYNVLSESLDDDGTLKDKSVTLPKINGGTTAGVLTTDASGNVTVGSKTTDANGWTVYDYGTWKEYVKKTANGSATKTQYEGWDVATETLPVGVVATDLKEVQVTPIWLDYTEFIGNINIRHTTTTNIVLRAASFRSGFTPYQYAFYIKLKV